MYDIYRSTADDACRFALGRSGRRRLVVVGLNPSTATREKSDPTVAKVAAYLEEIHGIAADSGLDAAAAGSRNLLPSSQ